MPDRIITREQARRAKLQEAAIQATDTAWERGILQQTEFTVIGNRLVVRPLNHPQNAKR